MENTLVTQDRLDALVYLCGRTSAKRIAEVGVYKGGSLKTLAEAYPQAKILGFDTFKGLPTEQWNEKEHHQPGEFSDTDIDSVAKFIDSENVTLVRGLFPESGEHFKSLRFDFVHIDTDFYESVKLSLEWFWPRLNKDAIIAFDDYEWPNCPGVKRALKEFGEVINESANYQAYLIKQ